MFRQLYDSVVRAAGDRRAPWLLGLLSFAESSFFPIPPDVMLAPMVMADRARAWQFALIATGASVLGGLFGYIIGLFFIQALLPWLQEFGYYDNYRTARQWFTEYGFWTVFLAGFSPIPYKVFTIAAGAVAMPFAPYVAASFLGRGARLFIVAGLVRWLGPVFEQHLLKYIDWIGWGIVVVIVAAVVVSQLH